MGRRLAEDVPVIGLYQTIDVFVATRDVIFDPRPDRRILGGDIGWKARRGE